MSIVAEIKAFTQKGQASKVKDLVQEALNQGIEVDNILQQGLIAAMTEVGEQFTRGEIYVPEMLIAARAMQQGLKILEPLLAEAGIEKLGKIVMGTVKGDLHDIGKNLVCMMLQGAGMEVIDLGVDVTPEKFVAAVKEHNPQIVGLSALLTTTMPYMKLTIDELAKNGLREKVKVLIGGAPVTEKFAEQIGADGYAANAGEAAGLVKKLLAI